MGGPCKALILLIFLASFQIGSSLNTLLSYSFQLNRNSFNLNSYNFSFAAIKAINKKVDEPYQRPSGGDYRGGRSFDRPRYSGGRDRDRDVRRDRFE
jgi:hypothetical protein